MPGKWDIIKRMGGKIMKSDAPLEEYDERILREKLGRDATDEERTRWSAMGRANREDDVASHRYVEKTGGWETENDIENKREFDSAIREAMPNASDDYVIRARESIAGDGDIKRSSDSDMRGEILNDLKSGMPITDVLEKYKEQIRVRKLYSGEE